MGTLHFVNRSLHYTGCRTLAFQLLFATSAQSQETIHLPPEDRPLVADFEEVFRVGAVEGEPWENFSTLVKLEFDARGNLYLFDGVANPLMPAQLAMLDELRVLVFDGAGDFLREFGRMGEGPGEFSWPEGYAVWRDGTVVVSDVRHEAYQLFDASGAFVRMVREPEGLMIWGMRGDPRGGAVLAERTGMSTRGWTSRPVLRLRLEGDEARADTVAEGLAARPGGGAGGSVRGGPRLRSGLHHHSRRLRARAPLRRVARRDRRAQRLLGVPPRAVPRRAPGASSASSPGPSAPAR